MKTKCLAKVKKFHSYPANMKEEAVQYAEINSNGAAARKHAVDKKMRMVEK